MRFLNLKQRVMFFTLTIALVLGLIVIFIIYPSALQILSLQNSIVNMEAHLDENCDKAQKLKKTLTELNQKNFPRLAA